jgi:hypothetical protein
MRTKGLLVLLVMGSLVLWMAACTSDKPATSSTPAAGTSTSSTSATAPATGTPTAAVSPTQPDAGSPSSGPGVDVEVTLTPNDLPTVDVEVTVPEMEGVFAGAATALEALASYRYKTAFTFIGESDGQPESGSIEMTGEVVAPDRQRIVWQDLGEGDQFELVQIGAQAWMLEEGEWSEIPAMVAEAMSQAVLVFGPAISWSGLYGGLETSSNYVGEETVNGVRARHYASTYNQWAGMWGGELVDASGDVWIADDGYPVRYRFSATGISEEGERGSVSWTMDLTDVNSAIAIEPPM